MRNDYKEFNNKLNKLELFGIKLGLRNTFELCKLLGNPQRGYKIIHIAGTNGKGSVAAMCSNILRTAGNKTGMYTSPHLQTFRERMQVNGRMISEKETVEVYNIVNKAVVKLAKQDLKATYFEVITAMALLYFKLKKCDIVVLECGMGGRLDATNIVKSDVAVITNISLEHCKYLGNTKQRIAYEKAGIIKKNGITIIGDKDDRIRQYLEKICYERGSKSVVVKNNYSGEIALKGEHQKINAAIAFAAIKSLGDFGITDKHIRNGIKSVRWPGRLETMQENPTVIIDGAHNPAGARSVAAYLKGKNVVLVIGISDNKDIKAILKILLPLGQRVIFTSAKYRGAKVSVLKKEAHLDNVILEKDVKKAVQLAMKLARGKMVVITGSLFVAGEAREIWHPHKRLSAL